MLHTWKTLLKMEFKFGELMLQDTELLLNIHFMTKLSGWEKMERHGSFNPNYLMVLIKLIMQIKIIQVTELDQMSKAITLMELVLTPSSETTPQ